MNKEIVIYPQKGKLIGIAIVMFLMALLFLFAIVLYFVEIPGIYADIPLIAVIFSFIAVPVFLFCSIIYFKKALSYKPLLIINQTGILEHITTHSVGMIRWEDIQDIRGRPLSEGQFLIAIILKEPEKYFTDRRSLDAATKKSSVNFKGHIGIPSLFLGGKLNEVIELMRYYFGQYQEK